jgi:integrase
MLSNKNIQHPTTLSLDAYYQEYYLPDKNKRIRPTTQKHHCYLYRNRVRPYFGDMIMNEITPLHIREWQNTQISLNFKPKYLRTLHQFLRGIFDYCVRFHDLAENPCDRVDPIGRHSSSRKASIWRLDEYEKVYECMTTMHHRAALALLFWAGLRKGELYGLQWRDYCSLRKKLRVERNYQRLNGKAILLPPKTDTSIRTIILPSQAYRPLDDYRARCKHIDDSDFIFKWTKRKLEDEIHFACKQARVQRIRIHDLRHSHASLLIHLNIDVAAISKRLGHSSIAITLSTYAHAYDNADRLIADTLEAISN